MALIVQPHNLLGMGIIQDKNAGFKNFINLDCLFLRRLSCAQSTISVHELCINNELYNCLMFSSLENYFICSYQKKLICKFCLTFFCDVCFGFLGLRNCFTRVAESFLELMSFWLIFRLTPFNSPLSLFGRPF